MSRIGKLGFWSALLSAILSIAWFVTYTARDAIAAVPSWQDVEAYAQAFSPWRTLYIYPSLLLALTFIVLLVCVHYSTSVERRVYSAIAVCFGILYATMASINYTIQAVAVRGSLEAGQTDGIAMFLPDNLNSVFGALANSYVYMALAMVVAGFAFEGAGLRRWIRWLFLAQIVTALGQIGESMFGLSMSVFIATSLVWVIGAPIAFALLALLFRREGTAGRARSTEAANRPTEATV